MVESAMVRRGIEVPDRQLACVPVSDPEGQKYLGAMAAAANFARANRHVLADGVRRTFGEVFGDPAVDVVYDVSHNVAKLEDYEVAGRRRTLCVHRKGATRAFGPDPGLPEPYRAIGQPVLVPGSMGTASWVALGTAESAELSFGSTCHGAGRTMSRKAATKKMSGHQLRDQLRSQGILVKANQIRQLAEEAPYAYKDVDEVIEVCNRIGLSKKVARLKPMVVVKG
jgi:tRNA-splicing ligase RtcB